VILQNIFHFREILYLCVCLLFDILLNIHFIYSSENNIWYSFSFILFQQQIFLGVSSIGVFWFYFRFFFYSVTVSNASECNIRNKETRQTLLTMVWIFPKMRKAENWQVLANDIFYRSTTVRTVSRNFELPHRTCNISGTALLRERCVRGRIHVLLHTFHEEATGCR